MTINEEKIVQGQEDPRDTQARREAWANRDQDKANTPTTLEDLERMVLGMPGVTQDTLTNAKRSRGDPMP